MDIKERQRYVGTYDFGVFPLRVIEEGGRLKFDMKMGRVPYVLLYQGDQVFVAESDPEAIRLTFSVSGERAGQNVDRDGRNALVRRKSPMRKESYMRLITTRVLALRILALAFLVFLAITAPGQHSKDVRREGVIRARLDDDDSDQRIVTGDSHCLNPAGLPLSHISAERLRISRSASPCDCQSIKATHVLSLTAKVASTKVYGQGST